MIETNEEGDLQRWFVANLKAIATAEPEKLKAAVDAFATEGHAAKKS